MSLIAQINEAAGIPLTGLRDALKKDKRVSKIFSKNLQLDEIDNPREFIQTLRFYILNNRNVIDFVKSRAGASNKVNGYSFRTLRELKPESLNQHSLESLQTDILDLLRDITATGNATYSHDTGKALWGWINKIAGYRGVLGHYAVRELKSLPSVRPEKPVVAYRGLLFSTASLTEKPDYNGGGSITVGDGLKFLRSQREGSRIVDLTFDEPTIWFRDKNSALDAAYNGDETWRKERKAIRGELAFIVSMIVKPEHIIVDTGMLPKVTPTSPVLVVDAGKYVLRVVHKFTPAGEVDPGETLSDKSESVDILENLQMFAHIFKPPFENKVFDSIDVGSWDSDRLALFMQLIKPEAKIRINKTMQMLIDYYNEYLKKLSTNELAELTAHKTLGAAAQVAREIADILRDKSAHPTERDTRFSGHRPLYKMKHEMTADELWDGRRHLWGGASLLKMKSSTPRITDWNTWNPVTTVMRMAGKPVVKDLNRKGAKIQHEEVLKTIEAFFHMIGEAAATDQNAAVDRMSELIHTYERNASALSKLWTVRELLDKLKD